MPARLLAARSGQGHLLRTVLWLVGGLAVSLRLGSTGRAEPSLPAHQIQTRPGFSIELLRSAEPGEDSWISFTFDDQGRIYLGLDGTGIARLALSADQKSNWEFVDRELRHCRGVLWAHNSLYVAATDSNVVCRLRDTDGDGELNGPEALYPVDYRSRFGHGVNQLVLGPDQSIYVVTGNDCSFPEQAAASSPYRNPQKDWLLPNLHDQGHDDRVGYILRMQADGGQPTIIAGGLRNPADMAFNSDGEMFTFDADMEWDVGLPWYRPIRINHIVSGGEYGWRWGTGKWPAYYADSLPTTLDVGLGSPTGLAFGYASQFPEPYRSGLFLGDWQNGRILMATLQPHGATYRAKYVSFLEGAPLNVCDLAFGPDGALYFITGGRGSQSGLYRVTWHGGTAEQDTVGHDISLLSAPLSADEERRAAQARTTRQQLEAWHSSTTAVPDGLSLDSLWGYLGDPDRWLRYAARLAWERQIAEGRITAANWRDRVNSTTPVTTLIAAAVALAHVGTSADVHTIHEQLATRDIRHWPPSDVLDLCRAYGLGWIRQGTPTDALGQTIAQQLSTLYPSENDTLNREITELLIYLRWPSATDTALRLLERPGTTQQTQIHLAKSLVFAPERLTAAERERILHWFVAARDFRGGHWLPTAISNLQANLIGALTEAERQQHSTLLDSLQQPVEVSSSELAADRVPQPATQHVWTVDEIPRLSTQTSTRPSFDLGRQAFVQAQCSKCHRMGEDGGQIGPDLTTVGKRFNRHDLLMSMIEPSRVIDDKYRLSAFTLHDGRTITGRVASITDKHLVIETDPLRLTTLEIPRDDIESSQSAHVSPMPSGLLNVLDEAQVDALLTYLIAGGDPQHEKYR